MASWPLIVVTRATTERDTAGRAGAAPLAESPAWRVVIMAAILPHGWACKGGLLWGEEEEESAM